MEGKKNSGEAGGMGMVKTAVNEFGERILTGTPSISKPVLDLPKSSSLGSEVRKARTDDSSKGGGISPPRRNVKLLVSQIDYASLSHIAKGDDKMLGDDFAEVMRVKKEIRQLKRDMAAVSHEKKQADRGRELSNSKARSLSRSAMALGKEIEEVNENHVLVELAMMEALKEYSEIASQREEEYRKFSSVLEEKKTILKHTIEDMDDPQKLELQLDMALSDVESLQNDLNHAKASGSDPPGNAQKSSTTMNDELKSAELHLSSITNQKSELTALIRTLKNELMNAKQETCMRNVEEKKQEERAEKLKGKLLEAKTKLKALTTSEENAVTLASNLTQTIDQVRAEEEEAHEEMMLTAIERAGVEHDIRKIEEEIDSKEEKLASAMQELEAVKSMESLSFERLQALAESVMGKRDAVSQYGSSITISAFEYEYLTRSAKGAETIADLKVSAARAWVDSLNASAREMQMKIESVEKRRAMKKSARRKAVKWGEDIVIR